LPGGAVMERTTVLEDRLPLRSRAGTPASALRHQQSGPAGAPDGASAAARTRVGGPAPYGCWEEAGPPAGSKDRRVDPGRAAARAGAGAGDALAVAEDEAAGDAGGGIDLEPLAPRPERPGHVAEVIGHVLLPQAHLPGELVGRCRGAAERVGELPAHGVPRRPGRAARLSRVTPESNAAGRPVEGAMPPGYPPCRQRPDSSLDEARAAAGTLLHGFPSVALLAPSLPALGAAGWRAVP
jgi:hypothetical protein